MAASIIITLCTLLLLSYLFDISSSKIKIPSAILLLALGWGVRQVLDFVDVSLPNMQPILPIIGTLGLILIVLEGSMELELSKNKMPLVLKSFGIALASILIFALALAFSFQYFGDTSFRIGLINAIPLSIVSSAIAIPSVQNFNLKDREFTTYETSLSDIIGVLFFNFTILNNTIDVWSFGIFFIDIIITLIITIICTLGLLYLLGRINHHVKYVPIILIVILVYEIEKVFNLPSLIFILLFGLFLANIDKIKMTLPLRYFATEGLSDDINKFRDLIIEIAFLIRSLFFLLFGFLIQTSELFNTSTILWALLICAGIFVLRFIILKIFRIPTKVLLFISPRGLITILLFLSIPATQSISIANKSLIIQVIILTALAMMFGIMRNKPKLVDEEEQKLE